MNRLRLFLLAVGGAGLAALLVAACLDLPDFGGRWHPYGERAVHASLARHTANTIASVNFDQRAYDTLGEMSILFAAVLGCVVLLRQARDEHRAQPEPAEVARPVRRYALLVLPVTLVTGLYVIAHGQLSPGGGFQGGVVAATALHLLYLGADYRALERVRPLGLYETTDSLAVCAYLVLGIAGVLAGTAFLANTPAAVRHVRHAVLGRHRPAAERGRRHGGGQRRRRPARPLPRPGRRDRGADRGGARELSTAEEHGR